MEPSLSNLEFFCDGRDGQLGHSYCSVEANFCEAGGLTQTLAEVLVDVLLDGFHPGEGNLVDLQGPQEAR